MSIANRKSNTDLFHLDLTMIRIAQAIPTAIVAATTKHRGKASL
jgi:hypothetical protein